MKAKSSPLQIKTPASCTIPSINFPCSSFLHCGSRPCNEEGRCRLSLLSSTSSLQWDKAGEGGISENREASMYLATAVCGCALTVKIFRMWKALNPVLMGYTAESFGSICARASTLCSSLMWAVYPLHNPHASSLLILAQPLHPKISSCRNPLTSWASSHQDCLSLVTVHKYPFTYPWFSR